MIAPTCTEQKKPPRKKHNMNTEQTSDSKYFWIFIATLLLAIAGYLVYALSGDNEPSDPILKYGYRSCKQSITLRGAEFEKAIMQRRERIPELADNLVGYKAKWELIWNGKEGFEKWTGEQISNTLYNPQENQRLLALNVKSVVTDWQEIENDMARQLGHPVIGNTNNTDKIKSPTLNLPPGLDGTVIEQILIEVAAIVGTEVATVVATELAVSGGILTASAVGGWGTFGLSLVAGVIVDYIISIFSDPTPQIEAELSKTLEENAAKMRAEFEKIMLKALDKRIKDWR